VAGFYPANQSNLKSFQKALIGWKKPAFQKRHFCFVNRGRLSIEPFFQPIFFHFESFLITFDWLEKILDRKPDPIEVIM